MTGGWIGEQTRELLGDLPSIGLKSAAREDDRVVGGATGTINHGVLHVHQLATAPTHRRLGLGARLLAELEAEAEAEAAPRRAAPRGAARRDLRLG